MTLSDFGIKVFNYFISNSEDGATILFVLDNETYSTLFENDDEKELFERKIKDYVLTRGLSFYDEYTAIALAAHQVLLAYEKIQSYLQNDTDRAINEAISSFYELNDIWKMYYHKHTQNDNKKLWEAVNNKFYSVGQRKINLPTSGCEYVKYPNEQIKFYRVFKNDEFNTIFLRWLDSGVSHINQIYSDTNCGDIINNYFPDTNITTIIPVLWAYYSLWKRNTKLLEEDKNIYIELYEENHVFKIAGDVFNRKRNHINPECKIFYKVFEKESENWWIGSKNEIPIDREFVLLVDINFEHYFSNTNPIKYKYIEDDCDFIVYKYTKRPENFKTDFPLAPQLVGGVRLFNNQYLDIPWLLPINNHGISYTKVTPSYNIDNSLKPKWNNIEGLKIQPLDTPKYTSDIEIQTKVFEERSVYIGNDVPDQFTEQEKAVLKCQQALFLWLATKGKASHLSIHNICTNLIENFECLKNIDNDYPEYFIFQPLFKSGIIELYETEEGKNYYALSRGGVFSTADDHSYCRYNNSDEMSTKNIEAFLGCLPSLENSFYKIKELFAKNPLEATSNAFVIYSTKYFWASGSYETKVSSINKTPSIFKTSNKVYTPTYFCDANGQTFKLNDDFANPWYPVSWNICESYIDLKKEKNLFIYYKKEKKLVCKDFTELPVHIARALICNDPEKLNDNTLWLSYFSPQHKCQEFNNVSERIYKILKNKYFEKRDAENILIKTNAKEKTFSFKGMLYHLQAKEDFRIFRFRVQDTFSCWQSDVDTDGIPENRPFGLLIDSGYGSNYISYTNVNEFKSDQTIAGRQMSFVVYKRMPYDFFEKLKYYNIRKSTSNNYLLELPKEKRNKILPKNLDGFITLFENTDIDFIIEILSKNYSIKVDNEIPVKPETIQNSIRIIFGDWVKDYNILNSITEIEDAILIPYNMETNSFRYEIVSFKIKDVRPVNTKKPLSGDRDKWQQLLHENKEPWKYLGYTTSKEKQIELIGQSYNKPLDNIKSGQIEENDECQDGINIDNVFNLQEKLFIWLRDVVGYATLDEIHEFLMRELETINDYEVYGVNPEVKILLPLLFSGIIDCRKLNDNSKMCYTISKAKKMVSINNENNPYNYQKHFSGGNLTCLDSDEIISYLYLLLNEKIPEEKIRNLEKISFIYDEKKEILQCDDMTKLPWQIGRALFMMDITKISEKESYLCGCKEYKVFNYKIVNKNYIYLLDMIITFIKCKH